MNGFVVVIVRIFFSLSDYSTFWYDSILHTEDQLEPVQQIPRMFSKQFSTSFPRTYIPYCILHTYIPYCNSHTYIPYCNSHTYIPVLHNTCMMYNSLFM